MKAFKKQSKKFFIQNTCKQKYYIYQYLTKLNIYEYSFFKRRFFGSKRC